LRQNAAARPQQAALVQDDDVLSYAQLDAQLDALMDRAAASLQASICHDCVQELLFRRICHVMRRSIWRCERFQLRLAPGHGVSLPRPCSACVVLDATADDCRSATSAQVLMVPPGLPDQKDKTAALGAPGVKKTARTKGSRSIARHAHHASWPLR